MKMNKRILSLILVIVMVLGMVPVASATDEAAVTCTECGSVGGHTLGCSQFVIPTCEECHGDLIGEKAGHSTACSQYKAPETTPAPASEEGTEGTTVATTVATTEGATEGTTVATTEATTAPSTEPSTEATTAPGDIQNAFYADLMECADFSAFYAVILEYVNDSEAVNVVMELTTEQIFELIDKASQLYSLIQEPTEENVLDWEDAMLTFSVLPNYREKCSECNAYPCICEVDLECNCGAEDGIHEKACPAFYESIYTAFMQATTVGAFGEISRNLNEIETSAFRKWATENELIEKFQKHMDTLFSGKVAKAYNNKKVAWAKPTGFSARNTDALKLDKKAVYDATTNKVNITLESYTTGVIQAGQVLPADTVLVLDTSGSMAYTYNSTRLGTPMYGDYFHHSSGNYWGWLLSGHLVDNRNPYVLLPNGTFAEAEYLTTDSNNVEIFRVVGTDTKFYPVMKNETQVNVPREYSSYPVYQLYSHTSLQSYEVDTGIPIFGAKFTYDGITYYGWLQDSHGTPYIRFEDGTFQRAYYSRTDSKKVEIFKYTDEDTGEVFEFYPRLVEKDSGVARAENLPVAQLYSGHSNQRMPALHDAVAEFLRMTAEKNVGLSASAQSRVAIVQFSCDKHGGSAPTKILKQMTAITKDNVDSWIADVYSITDGGAHTHTEIGEGMLLAEDIIEGITRTSHKAVIAFTDGKPECDETTNGGYSFIEADKAIGVSNRLINNYSADVYAVCIQQHAQVNAGQALPPREGKGVNDDKNNVNRLMHLMSGNYPEAVDMSTPGSTGSTSEGYYMVPGGSDDLTSIFTHIGAQIGNASMNLDSTATVQDYVTPYFFIPDGATVSISVKDAVYNNGNLSWKDSTMNTSNIKTSINEAEKSVTVSGFDYNHNFVASQGRVEGDISQNGNFHGRKLVINFSVIPNDGFLGGEHIITNEDESGVYSNNNIVKPYNVPNVDIPLKTITPDSNVKNIYISQTASLPDVANIGSYKLDDAVYEIDGIRNGYLDITYTIKDKTTGNVTSLMIPAGTKSPESIVSQWIGELDPYPELINDTQYEITCTISSSADSDDHNASDPNYQDKSGKQDVEMLVYKPVITFNDSAIELGDIPDYATENGGTPVVWKHGEDDPVNMATRREPELVYTYSPAAAAFTEDTPVKVTVISKQDRTNSIPADLDITQYVTFYRDACDYQDCDHRTKTQVSATDANRINFVVHLKSFNLKIKKEGANLNLDPNTSFVFRITREETGFSMDVVINGNGEIVIENLPAGVYTVTELTDWSWRYEPVDGVQEASAANANNGTTTVIFENNRDQDKWLDGESYAKNVFAGVAKAN